MLNILDWKFPLCKNCFDRFGKSPESYLVGVALGLDGKFFVRLACRDCGQSVGDFDDVQKFGKALFALNSQKCSEKLS